MRHITGSSKAISIAAGLGHSVSLLTLQWMDTNIAIIVDTWIYELILNQGNNSTRKIDCYIKKHYGI